MSGQIKAISLTNMPGYCVILHNYSICFRFYFGCLLLTTNNRTERAHLGRERAVLIIMCGETEISTYEDSLQNLGLDSLYNRQLHLIDNFLTKTLNQTQF